MATPSQPPLPPTMWRGTKGCLIALKTMGILCGLVVTLLVLIAILGSFSSPPSSEQTSRTAPTPGDSRSPAGTPRVATQKTWEQNFSAGAWHGPKGTLRYFPVDDGVAKMEMTLNAKNIGYQDSGTGLSYDTLALGTYIGEIIFRKVNQDSSIRRVEIAVTAIYDPWSYKDKYGQNQDVAGRQSHIGNIVINDVAEVRKYTEKAYAWRNHEPFGSMLTEFKWKDRQPDRE